MEATTRVILLWDAQGTKYDSAMKSAMKRLLPGTVPYSTVNVLKGELLVEYRQDDQPFNFRLHRDPNVFLYCEADNVAPLGPSEFRLLEAVWTCGDRMEAFSHKLEWGVTLKEGSKVYVTIPGKSLSAPVHARAVVHYKGKVGNQSGILFGVEFLGQSHRAAKLGTTDGTFQGHRYFTCEDGCGLFVTVKWLSPADASTSNATVETRREEPKPTYSNVASRDISGPPSQPTWSKDKPPLNKSASTDSSPSLPPPSQGNKPSYSKLASTDVVHSRPATSYSKLANTDDVLSGPTMSKGKPPTESSVDLSTPPPQFQIGQRVMFYDKNNKKLYGVVGWTGRESATKKFDYTVVGIQADDDIFKSDFADSIVGLDQYLKRTPKRRVLFLPEVLVEAVPGALPASDPPSQPDLKLKKENTLLRQQIMDLLQAQGELQTQVKRLTDTLQDKQAEIQTRVKDFTDAQAEIQTRVKDLTDTLEDKQAEIQSKAQQIADLQKKLDDDRLTQIIEPSSSKAKSWNVPRAEIQRIAKNQIGFGAWRVVYSAKFRGENVAIKIAHREIFHESTVDMLKREVTIMSHIQHPNLVRFIAAVWDDAVERKVDTPIIISELMDTNLRAAYRSVDLSNSLISIFCDVAYALHYLHQHRQPIIHRDISAPNVLLKSSSDSYRAKVSDFGSANLVKQSKTAGAGAIVYCAPEMFPHEDISVPPQPQTTKVDVFSYGILLLEVLSKEMPTQEKRYAMLQKIKGQWNEMYELIVHCTKPSPSHRPAMADILSRLNSIPQ